ncbi:MAG: hypothetical protein NT031_06430 [Planctomycetota bacterium]|nr:hypothetical protein [Planctomycetota bacterium]
MAKKMYYTEAEATQMLKANKAQLDALVRDGKLRVFMDGDRRMFKTEQVDAMTSPGAASDEIELAPADLGNADPMAKTTLDSGIRDAVRLDQVRPIKPGKEDTAITSEGISIFDEEDLDVETADPMAKTQIAPGLEDQVSLDGLDLTRESDDTSLGAELLDGINMEEGAPAEGDVAEVGATCFPAPAEEIEAPVIVEALDRNIGAFQGLALAGGVLALLIGGIMLAGIVGLVPDYLKWFHANTAGVTAGLVVLTGVATAVGWYLGKAAIEQKLAMRRAGGRM